MHGPICPCCAPRRGAGVGALFELVCGVLFVAAVAAGRFLSGRPLLQQVGPLDSTYTAWAPPVPDEAPLMRVVLPRTSWGRRPGWQRQVVRLLAVAVAVAFLTVPVVTVAALVGAAAAGTAAWVAWARLPLAPVDPATAAPLGPVTARAGVRGPRRGAPPLHQQTQQDWSELAAWMGGPATVRAHARRMDRGGAS
jgi:hypothetical protein